MPCSDWGNPSRGVLDSENGDLRACISSLEKRNEKLAQMLCHTLSITAKSNVLMKQINKETKEWWDEHQKLDEKQHEKEVLASALAKLSPEERRVINKNRGL